MDVGVYGRISLAKRAEHLTELAIDRQHERSVAYCQAKGWTPAKFYADVDGAYRKPGKRAAPPRQNFEQSLRDVETGIIKGLVFFKLDRFVRDQSDLERALAVCEAHGAILASATEPLDTSTPAGELVARLLVDFARLESQTIGHRVAAQAEQAARMGAPPRQGRYKPFGYTRDGLSVIESEAQIIRQITERLLAGRSIGSVIRWLTAEGIPAPEGGSWNRSKLSSAITNPRLAGHRAYHGEIVAEGSWPAIISVEEFDRLRRMFEQRAKPGRSMIRRLLSGIIACACGELMGTHLHSRGFTRYICISDVIRAGQERPGCGRVTVAAEPVDVLIAERVLDRLASPPRIPLSKHLDSAEYRDVARGLEADKRALEEAAQARFVDRTLDVLSYLAVKAKLQPRIADAERQLAIDARAAVLAALPKLRADLDLAWGAADIEQRRAIIAAAVERVVIHPARRRGPGLDPDRVEIPPDAWRV